MTTATIERGNTSVTLDLLDDQSQTPLVAVDYGKPNLNLHNTGDLNPRFRDSFSGLQQYTLTGRLFTYSNVNTLMDLVKSNGNGDPLTLNIGMSEFDTDISVIPAAGQEEALTAEYRPGHIDNVVVDLALTRVSRIDGGTSQPASTPTTSGSGPIQLTDGSTTVNLNEDVQVARSVGRPGDDVKKDSTELDPFAVQKQKTAYDGFELSFEFVDDTTSDIADIRSLFRQQLGQSATNDSLTLKFNGIFGLGDFNVIPEGSSALRHTRESGEKDVTQHPSLSLRRVTA